MSTTEPGPDHARDVTGGPPGARVVIVTGASSGIGRDLCSALASDGAHVVAVGRDTERLGRTVQEAEGRAGEHGSRVLGLRLDVGSESDMAEMAAQTLDAFGRIDVLVTAAGTLRGTAGWPRQAVDMRSADWDEVIRTNLTGVFLSNRAVLPAMVRQRGGDIVNISSTSGRRGLAYDSAYCASKFGVIGLSQSLAQEVGQLGVRVQALLPGAVRTPMWLQGDAIPHPGPALPVDRVTDLIRHLLTLANDAELITPTVAPFGAMAPVGSSR